jgi:MFS family permease
MLGRFLTGIGVGSMLPLAHVLADEYATQNRRGISVALVTLGFPIGSLIGGIASLVVITSFGGAWQALFWFGAIVSAVVTVLVWLTLPESPAYLAAKGPAAASHIAVIARRMKLTGVDVSAKPVRVEPAGPSSEDKKIGVLSARYRVRSILIWVGYTFGILGYYFINSWTPQLIATAANDVATGALMATVISIGAITGGVLFALITLRVIPTKLCWIALCVAVVAQVVFALTMSGVIAYTAAVLLGMGAQAGMSAYMTGSTRLYPTQIRARALGLMGGFSRVGSITAPLLVGALLTIVAPAQMYLGSSVILFICLVAAFALWKNTKHVFEGAEEETTTGPSPEPARTPPTLSHS